MDIGPLLDRLIRLWMRENEGDEISRTRASGVIEAIAAALDQSSCPGDVEDVIQVALAHSDGTTRSAQVIDVVIALATQFPIDSRWNAVERTEAE